MYPGIDPTAEPLLELPEGVVVSLIGHSHGWSKIQYKTEIGYISRKDLISNEAKTSNIVVSIPFECANALFEALKFALKK